VFYARVYLVEFTQAKFIKCLKIMKKEDFNENEWNTAKILFDKKNKNIIDYDGKNEVNINNEIYVALMLEYANAGVFFFLN
jgi:hypothetical protein